MLLVKDGYLVNFAHFDHTIDNKDKPKENLGEQKELLPLSSETALGLRIELVNKTCFKVEMGIKVLRTFSISFC